MIIIDTEEDIEGEVQAMLQKHECTMGLIPMRIFLSHKSVDKEWVIQYKLTLELLGFRFWLDIDAMPAGTEPDSGILNGMKESCAMYLVTENYNDDGFLRAR